MTTTTTTEHMPLAVAAPSDRARLRYAVAAMPAPCTSLAIGDVRGTSNTRIAKAAFGTWNPSRRLVGFVT
jgi:hypothetical protein